MLYTIFKFTILYSRSGQTFMLAGQFSTDKLHCGPQEFFFVCLSHVKRKILQFKVILFKIKSFIKIFQHLFYIFILLFYFATGAAEYLRRSACAPRVSALPRLLYSIGLLLGRP